MKYRFLMLGVLMMSALYVINTQAACPTTDAQIEGAVVPTQTQNKTMVETKKSIAKEEDKLRQDHNGRASCSASPAKAKPLKSESYEYVRKEIFLAPDSQILPAQKDYTAALKKVESLFMPTGEDASSSTQGGDAATQLSQAKQLRKQYIKEVATKATEIFAVLPEKAQADADEMEKAPIEGCNKMHAYIYENRNLLAYVKLMAASIGEQVLRMELEAGRDILKEPMRMVTLPDDDKKEKSE